MPYNPFDKPIGEKLNAADLQSLIEQNVQEGYFVEYKSEPPKNKKIGRSIASFANSYGGWYIIGAKTDNHHVANDTCGFSLADHPDPVAKAREIAKTHISPVPMLYPQTVDLGNGNVVLVVYTPGEQEKPFITRDGRIYRRTADSSDPIPETDRYAVDRLVEEGKTVARQFERFCQDERTFSQAEEEQSWLKLYVSPHPLSVTKKLSLYSVEDAKSALELSHKTIPFEFGEVGIEASGNIPFNTVQTTSRSIILRQVTPQNVAFNTLTAEFFHDGRAKFFVPLNHFTIVQENDIGKLESDRVKQVLSDLIESDHDYHTALLRFLDIGEMWLAITALLNLYREWRGSEVYFNDLKVGVSLEGVWRSVPFFDSDHWGDYADEVGVPVVGTDIINIPYELGQGLLVSLDDTLPYWITVCGSVSQAVGLVLDVGIKTLIEAMVRAGKRSDFGPVSQR